MRRLAVGILAFPVLAALYVSGLARRRIRFGLVVILAVLAIGAVTAFTLLPRGSEASASMPIEPVPAAAFSPLIADRPLDAAATIAFTTPMDRASVKAALEVAPAAQVRLSWDAASRTLTVRPSTNWSAATAYDISVGTTAKSQSGKSLRTPAHALFLTRAATTGQIDVARTPAGLVRGDATFGLRFELPVDVASVRSALAIEPPVPGTLAPQTSGGASDAFTFTPTAPLAPSTTYTIAVSSTVVDRDGGLVAAIAPVQVTTVGSPQIVRSRPSGGATGVAASALLSIRFSAPMDRASTAAALSVTQAGKTVAGKVSWYEGDTVVAFDPKANLSAGARIRLALTSTARSAEGMPLAKPLGITFTIAKPPAPKPAAKPVTRPVTPAAPTPTKPAPKPVTPPPPSGGGSAGSAPWYAVETYYLRLLNCTRTGGWVTSGGACGSIPSRLSVRPPAAALVIDAGISTKVTRPYAKYLAINGLCNHFYDGSPGDRLRRAGYTSYRWGENIGCPYGDPNSGMIAVERFFQNETPSGGHYVNLMNPAYDRAGIGVWVSSSRVRVVIDFYHP